MAETRRETFEVGENPSIELKSLPSGGAVFIPGEAGVVEVEVRGESPGDFTIKRAGNGILIRASKGRLSRWGDYDVRVKSPPVERLSVDAASADIDVRVEVKQLGVDSASGDVRALKVTGECGIHTASGDVRIEGVDGECGVKTASGDVDIASSGGELGVSTASGDLRVETSTAEIGFRSASGDLFVERYEGPQIECLTRSGDVRIGLPPGRDVDLQLDTLSGEIDVQFDPQDPLEEVGSSDVSLRLRTLSGDILLTKTR